MIGKAVIMPSPANLEKLAEVLGVAKKVFYDESLTLAKGADMSALTIDYRELQSKYINRLEADIKTMERVIQILKKRLRRSWLFHNTNKGKVLCDGLDF